MLVLTNKQKTNIKMKNKKLTSLIRKERSVKHLNNIDHVPALLANIFSVLFATSIIFELKNSVETTVLIVLSIFIILFLIGNEAIKVKEIRKVFLGNRNSLLLFLVTFIISFSLSTIGIYFYTNNTDEIKQTSNIDKISKLQNIHDNFESENNKILNLKFENSDQYKSLNSELSYWKHAKAADMKERTEIHNRIDKIQNKIQLAREKFNEDQNFKLKNLEDKFNNQRVLIETEYNNNVENTSKIDFITYIFLTLVIIAEFATIALNKAIVDKKKLTMEFTDSNLAKTYIVASNILTSLYLSAKKDVVSILDAQYSYANKDNNIPWDEIKRIYNNFISLGILSQSNVQTIDNKKVPFNELLLDETDAHEKLDTYFEKMFTM